MKHIVQVCCMIDTLRTEGALQAAGTHPEPHSVHVDLSREWFFGRNCCHICLVILEEWNQYLNFSSTPFPNVSSE